MFARNVLFDTVLEAFQSCIIFDIDNILWHSEYIKFSRTQKQSDFPHLLIKIIKRKPFILTDPFQAVPNLSMREHKHFLSPERIPKHNSKTIFAIK